MKLHTVKQLAMAAGVSVKTLHHYDEIGLLKPAQIGSNGYRYYGEKELLRLQKIMLFRELDMPLMDVGKALLADRDQTIEGLRLHRKMLDGRIAGYRQLISTIDLTLAHLEAGLPMNSKDLYRGFSAEKQAEYEQWLIDKHGETMRQDIVHSKQQMGHWPEGKLADRSALLTRLEAGLAELCRGGAAPHDERLQPLLKAHRDWVAEMWGKPCPLLAYAGLADLYESHPDFVARYEAIAPGFGSFLPAAMRHYAATESDVGR